MELEPRPVADSEPEPPLVEAQYEEGCFAQARVLSSGALHRRVKFIRREPNWHPATVLATLDQTLSQIASKHGYPPVLLLAANRSLGAVSARLKARTVVNLPAAVARAQGESLAVLAARYNVEVADLVRHNTDEHSAGSDRADLCPDDAQLLHSTWLLLPPYRPPGPAPALPRLPRLSSEEPVPADAHKARCCMPTLAPHCPCACQGPVAADTAVVCQP